MQIKVKTRTIENLLLIGLFIVVLLVTPYSSIDPINLPKMSALGIFAFTIFALTLPKLPGWIGVQHRKLIGLSLLFAFQLLLVLIFSGRSFTLNFYGIFGRNTGVLTYLSLLMVLFVSAVVASQVMISRYVVTFFIIGVILLCYGVIQHFGLEPFPFQNIYANQVFGTFGNPNFHSAFMGILGAIAFTTIWNKDLIKIFRLIAGLIFFLSILSINSTNSWQGFFNLAAGIGVAVILLAHQRGLQKLGNYLLVIGVLIVGMVGLGLLNQGPLADVMSKASLTARRIYWEAALKMLFDHPFTGVGLDGFGDWFRRSRSTEAFKSYSGFISDSAHSVPLEIGAGGGFPLLVTYFGLLLLTLHSIIKVIKKQSNLNFGFITITAAWFSYQAQSLISINQIGLGLIGWTLSGLIIGFASLGDDVAKAKEPKKNTRVSAQGRESSTFTSFVVPIIGLIVSCLISLPPFIASNRFYEGLKTSDARVVVEKAYAKPLDPRRLLIAVNILERNKFYKESFEMTKFTSQEFPDSYEVWTTLRSLTNASDNDKLQATKQLSRLEPNIKP